MAFPNIAREQWEHRVCSELKGKSPQELNLRQLNGLTRSVFYQQNPSVGQTFSSSEQWHRIAPAAQGSVEKQNAQMLSDLKGGIDSVSIRAEDIWGASYLDRLLDGIHLSMIQLHLRQHIAPLSTAAILQSWYEEQRHDTDLTWESLSIHWGIDPFSQMWSRGRTELFEHVFTKSYTEQLAQLPSVTLFRCSDRWVHNAGATDVEELAVVLAAFTALIRRADSAQIALQTLASKLQLELTVGRDLYSSIIKIRAARRLFQGLYHELGLTGTPWVLVRTSERMLSRLDPWVNMLRLTVASTAAASCGIDGMIILPFDWPIYGSESLCSELGHRVSRNLHPLLAEEASVGFFEDPAAGSYFFETETERLCEAAWNRFQAFEESGGILAQYKSGKWPEDLCSMWKERSHKISMGTLPITGVSQFPLSEEYPLPDSMDVAFKEHSEEQRRAADFRRARGKLDATGLSALDLIQKGATLQELPSFPAAECCQPLDKHRDSEDFEQLRRLSEEQSTQVFVLSMGPEATWRARADFVRDFLVAGGIEVVFAEQQDVEIQLEEAQSYDCVCLCGADDSYELLGIHLHSSLIEQGTSLILAAGRNSALGSVLSLYRGMDQIAILKQIIGHANKGVV